MKYGDMDHNKFFFTSVCLSTRKSYQRRGCSEVGNIGTA